MQEKPFSFLEPDKGGGDGGSEKPKFKERLLGVGRTGSSLLEIMVKNKEKGGFKIWVENVLPYIQEGKIHDMDKIEELRFLAREAAFIDIEHMVKEAKGYEATVFDRQVRTFKIQMQADEILKVCKEQALLTDEEIKSLKREFNFDER